MIKTQLLSKVVGQPCRGTKFNGFHAPVEAVTYNQVTGISRKGNFEITSFYDDTVRLTKQVSKYTDKDGNETLKIKRYSSEEGFFSEIIAINGKVKEFISKLFDVEPSTQEVSCITERLINTKRGTRDYHEFALFKKGQKPKKMSYRANWDGNPPEIQYTNIKSKMPEVGLEYMPLLVSYGANPRYSHLSKVNIRKYDLEGVATEAKRLEFTELNPEFKSFKEVPDDECSDLVHGFTEANPPTGKVFVSDYAKAPEELIRIYAHEYKHVDDLSHILRLKYVADGWKKLSHEDFQYLKANEPEYYNFVTGSIKKGLIEKGGENSKDYHYYKSLEKYLDCEKYEKQVKTMQDQLFHPVEVGPIREAQKELKKFELLQKNIRKILHSD